MKEDCKINGGDGCAEVKILTNSYRMLDKKIEDSRTENRQMHEDSKKSIETLYSKLNSNHQAIIDEVKCVRKDMRDEFVSKIEFDPVKKIVYGTIKIIVTGVLVALLGLVIYSQTAI